MKGKWENKSPEKALWDKQQKSHNITLNSFIFGDYMKIYHLGILN